MEVSILYLSGELLVLIVANYMSSCQWRVVDLALNILPEGADEQTILNRVKQRAEDPSNGRPSMQQSRLKTELRPLTFVQLQASNLQN